MQSVRTVIHLHVVFKLQSLWLGRGSRSESNADHLKVMQIDSLSQADRTSVVSKKIITDRHFLCGQWIASCRYRIVQ